MPKQKRYTKAGAAIQRRLAEIARASKDSLNSLHSQESYETSPSKGISVCVSSDEKEEK